MSLPSLGPFESLRFVHDPPAFLAAGRALGPAWRFRFPGTLSRATVVSTREAGAAVLDHRALGFYRPALLAAWLGKHSPLLAAGEARSLSRWRATTMLAPLLRRGAADPGTIIRECLLDAEVRGGVFDIGPALRLAALRWIVEDVFVGSTDARAELLASIQDWLGHADTPALVVPWVRLFSSTWRGMAECRLALVAAVSRCLPRSLVTSDDVELVVDAAITLIAGIADNPPIVAAQALLAGAGCSPDHAVELALGEPPVPLLLREALEDCEVAGLTLRRGEAIAVDAAAAGLPFGAGEHACIGSRPAKQFAAAAVRAVRQLGLEVVGEPGRSRLRLSWGVTSLPMSR